MTNPETNRTSGNHDSSVRVSGGLIVLLLLLVGVLLYQVFFPAVSPLFNPEAQPRVVTPRGDLAEDEKSTIELFRAASPSVVHITSLAVRRNALNFNIFEIPQGTGSGFVWDEDGNIVTNYHVIQSAQAARVTLTDNSVWDARLVGAEPDKDIAVLKIDAPRNRLVPIPVGQSSDLQVGQKVFAIGNPFGLDQTLTTGVISGLGREIQSVTRRPIQGVIQTDAAINPGNSGGPLLDSAGRLIGVNTAIYSPSGTHAGIGFAVPVDTVNRIVPELVRRGHVERPGLGIYIFDDNVVEQLHGREAIPEKGVLVRDVMEGGAADKAGLQSTRRLPDGEIEWGDLIVAVDGVRIQNSTELFKELEDREVGEAVVLTLKRADREEEVEIELQALPSVNP